MIKSSPNCSRLYLFDISTCESILSSKYVQSSAIIKMNRKGIIKSQTNKNFFYTIKHFIFSFKFLIQFSKNKLKLK